MQEQFINKLIKKMRRLYQKVEMIQPNVEFYSFIRRIKLAARDIEQLQVNSIICGFWDSLQETSPMSHFLNYFLASNIRYID